MLGDGVRQVFQEFKGIRHRIGGCIPARSSTPIKERGKPGPDACYTRLLSRASPTGIGVFRSRTTNFLTGRFQPLLPYLPYGKRSSKHDGTPQARCLLVKDAPLLRAAIVRVRHDRAGKKQFEKGTGAVRSTLTRHRLLLAGMRIGIS